MNQKFIRDYEYRADLEDGRKLVLRFQVAEYPATPDSPDCDAVSPYVWALDGEVTERSAMDVETEREARYMLAYYDLSDDGE